MSFNLIEIFQSMGLGARIVAGVLLVMGLASLTVFVERIIALRRSRQQSKQFAATVAPEIHAGAVASAIDVAAQYPHGALARLLWAGLNSYWQAVNDLEPSDLTPTERARRCLERQLEELGADLRRGMPVLSSVGSVAPFVGLLGTVLGIIAAFQGIAATGSGGLSSVSAGIAEALIETAFGLAVAIPAVLAFNYLSTAIARDELALTNAAGELVDTLEGWGERAVQESRRGRVA